MSERNRSWPCRRHGLSPFTHELTYTIENVLAKINAELSTLAETLEEVRIASEAADIDRVQIDGHEYLSIPRGFVL